MRFLLAFSGIIVSLPPLIFFWIGSQTFIRLSERILATAITIESGALLALSTALLFTPSAQRVQTILLVVTIFTLAVVFGANRLLK